MTRAEFDKLPQEERYHFVLCQECGEYIDMRQRDEVMCHNTKHRPRSEFDAAVRTIEASNAKDAGGAAFRRADGMRDRDCDRRKTQDASKPVEIVSRS
jgi:hypothetical protein